MSIRFVPKIAKPCPKLWSELDGEGRRRFCEQCQHHVHNLSEMTPQEQRKLLASSKKERICVAYQDAPGVIPVRRGLLPLLDRLSHPVRTLGTVATLITSLFVSSCASSRTTSAPATPPPPAVCHHPSEKAVKEVYSGKMTVGVFPMQRPLWRRILFFWERD